MRLSAAVLYLLLAQLMMRVGFNVGGSPNTIDADLTTLNGSIYANFCCSLDTSRLSDDASHNYTNLRILRYTKSCPSYVMSGCVETVSQLQQFVATYKGQTWELGNEPGNSGQDGGGKGFQRWEVNVYNAIKASDPSALVIGPGVLNADTNTYNNLKYDAIAFHLYPSDACMTGAWVSENASTIATMAAFAAKQNKPLYMTEMSDFWPSCSPAPSAEVRQADVAAVKAALQNAGVVAAIWFTEGDLSGMYGTGYLFGSDGLLTPEGLAWQN